MDLIVYLLRRNLVVLLLLILFLVLLFALLGFSFHLFLRLRFHFFDFLLVFFNEFLLLFQLFGFQFLLFGYLLFSAVFDFAEITIQLNIGVFLDVIFIVVEVRQTLRIDASVNDYSVPINIDEIRKLIENLGHNLHFEHSFIATSRTLWNSIPVLSISLRHPEGFNEIVVSELSWRKVSDNLVLVLAHHIIEELVSLSHFLILIFQEVFIVSLFFLLLLIFILFFEFFVNLSIFFIIIEILEQLFDAFFLFLSVAVVGHSKKLIHKFTVFIIIAVTILDLGLNIL